MTIEREPYWKFSLGYQGVTLGKVGTRWVHWDAPWTEDVIEFDCPMRFVYHGKKISWSLGATHQKYNWFGGHWSEVKVENWKRFVIYPANDRERFKREEAYWKAHFERLATNEKRRKSGRREWVLHESQRPSRHQIPKLVKDAMLANWEEKYGHLESGTKKRKWKDRYKRPKM